MSPFAANASLVSTDLDNTLRGIYRDNSDHALTGSVAETDLASVSITGGSIGATGGLAIYAAGTLAGTAGTKTLRLYLGATVLATITQGASTTTSWFFSAWLTNTSNSAQRLFIQRNTNDLLTSTFSYATSAIDTSANATLKVTGQLGNSGDTITQTMFDVLVVQIQ